MNNPLLEHTYQVAPMSIRHFIELESSRFTSDITIDKLILEAPGTMSSTIFTYLFTFFLSSLQSFECDSLQLKHFPYFLLLLLRDSIFRSQLMLLLCLVALTVLHNVGLDLMLVYHSLITSFVVFLNAKSNDQNFNIHLILFMLKIVFLSIRQLLNNSSHLKRFTQ